MAAVSLVAVPLPSQEEVFLQPVSDEEVSGDKAEPVSVLGQMWEKPFFILCLGGDFSREVGTGSFSGDVYICTALRNSFQMLISHHLGASELI